MWLQRSVTLPPHNRGFHLITQTVIRAVPEISQLDVGLLHLFIQHTSASLSLNENASAEVRHDFETYFNRTAPDNWPPFTHTLEGPDDMAAHIKSSLLGASLSIPVRKGHLALGRWQGIYLGEHRDNGGQRTLLLTLQGQPEAIK